MKISSLGSLIDEDIVNLLLGFLLSIDSQVQIFHLGLPFLKKILLEMELILSLIKDVDREALDFLLHYYWMLDDKVSNHSNLVLYKLLDMFKIVKVAVFLLEQMKYKTCLNFPAKRRILGLHEGLKFCKGFLWSVKKMNGLLSGSLIEKIKDAKAEEAGARPLHVARSSVSNWPKNDQFGSSDFFLGNLGELLDCRADLNAHMNCEIEVLLRHFKPDSITITDVAVRLNDQLELTMKQITRESLQIDTVGMTGFGKISFIK